MADSFSVYTKGVEDNVFRPFVRLMTYEVRHPPAERLNTSARDGSSFLFFSNNYLAESLKYFFPSHRLSIPLHVLPLRLGAGAISYFVVRLSLFPF